jgi:hypothetical protein
MDPLDETTQEGAQGLSRRQLLGRVGGSLAGAALASLGLDHGRRAHAQAQAGTISLRDLLRRISAEGCDPSGGIRPLLLRALLPANPSVISIRDMARRYGGKHDHCRPLQFSVRHRGDANGNGVFTVLLTGENFTPGGQADIQLTGPRGTFGYPRQVRPDGTFFETLDLGCGYLFTVRAIDVASGRSAEGGTVSSECPPPPPPPPIPPPPTPPVITDVSRVGSVFTVKGTGFLPNHIVHVRIVEPQTFRGNSFDTRSDTAGGINFVIHILADLCLPSGQLSFSANDDRQVPVSVDRTGVLWSNSKKVTCA